MVLLHIQELLGFIWWVSVMPRPCLDHISMKCILDSTSGLWRATGFAYDLPDDVPFLYEFSNTYLQPIWTSDALTASNAMLRLFFNLFISDPSTVQTLQSSQFDARNTR